MLFIKKMNIIFIVTILIFFVSLSGFVIRHKVFAASYNLRLGHDQMEDTPHHAAAEMFKKIVENKTEGDIEVNIYPAEQLGNARSQIEDLQYGSIEAVTLPTAPFSGFENSIGMLDLPYLFPEPKIAYEILDGKLGTKLLNRLSNVGIKGAAYWTSGFKNFTSNIPIDEPSDFEGQRFRTMDNPVIMAHYEEMGASAVPISFHELYNALQQGAVNGQENPLSTIVNMAFYEVQDYVTISHHGFLGYVFAFSELWFDTLPQNYQDILIKAARESAIFQRAEIKRLEDEKYLPTIKSSGTKIIRLTDKQLNDFINISRNIYDDVREDLDSDAKEILDQIVKKTK